MRGRRFILAVAVALAACSLIENARVIDAARAEPAEDTQKQAFEAAKELGTVEAWDAFLSNYQTGFYADLARAYVKKLAAGPLPAPTAHGANCSRHEVFSSSMKQCIPKSAMCEQNEVYSSSLASCMPKM